MSRFGVITVIAAVFATALVLKEERRFELNGTVEQYLRMFTMSLAGIIIGLLLRIGMFFFELDRHPEDRLMPPIALIVAAFFFAVIFMGLHLLSILKMNYITWRTPFAFMTFLLAIYALFRLKTKVRRAANRATGPVRLALMEYTADGMKEVDLGKNKNG